jgi:hypothetical protein
MQVFLSFPYDHNLGARMAVSLAVTSVSSLLVRRWIWCQVPICPQIYPKPPHPGYFSFHWYFSLTLGTSLTTSHVFWLLCNIIGHHFLRCSSHVKLLSVTQYQIWPLSFLSLIPDILRYWLSKAHECACVCFTKFAKLTFYNMSSNLCN